MFEWTHDELPKPTDDLETLKSNIDEFGYCLVKDAMPADQLAAARQRLLDQAKAELQSGYAFEDGGAKQQWGAFTDEEGKIKRDAFSAQAGGVNQRLWMLVNKGQVFLDMLTEPDMRAVIGHVLGVDYLLSGYTANIAKPGGIAMNLHTDQWWMPEPIHRKPSPVPAGSLSRDLSNREDDFPSMIAPPVVVNVMWMLNDFTEANGATRIVPRSHLFGRRPDKDRDKDVVSIPAEGRAGTAMLFDGRIWHGTGANISEENRLGVLTTFVAPQFRSQENYTVGASKAVIDNASPDLLALLGFKIWNAYGRVESPVAEYIQQGEQSLGELRPGQVSCEARKTWQSSLSMKHFSADNVLADSRVSRVVKERSSNFLKWLLKIGLIASRDERKISLILFLVELLKQFDGSSSILKSVYSKEWWQSRSIYSNPRFKIASAQDRYRRNLVPGPSFRREDFLANWSFVLIIPTRTILRRLSKNCTDLMQAQRTERRVVL